MRHEKMHIAETPFLTDVKTLRQRAAKADRGKSPSQGKRLIVTPQR